jgi:hypothetical protein
MKKLLIIVLALLITQTCYVNAQPQWKFYLAFEDGIGAKDTMWFIWDTTAMFFGIDTLLGEGNVQFDYDIFNVYALTWGIYPEIDTTKVVAIPYDEYFEVQIKAFNYELPLKISWDTLLFHAGYLPPEPVGWVNYARLYSDYFFWVNNNPIDQDFDMTLIDTVMSPDPSITDPWFWQTWIHFPLSVYMHQETDTDIKLNLSDGSKVIINPNPSKDYLKIQSDIDLMHISILDMTGKILCQENVSENNFFMDISFLKNGIYFINILNSQNQNYYEKFIKSD